MRWLFIVAFLFALPLQAQVERATWNGKEYYVYPHQDESQSMGNSSFNIFAMLAESKEVLQRDEKNRKVISVTVEPIKKEEQSAFLLKERKFRKTKEFFLLALQAHPELFYHSEPSIREDIIPATEPLPDGDYIQYYRDLPYLDGKIMRYRNDVVAAVFSIKNGQLNGSAQWIAANGKIIKQGQYVNGTRDGVWNTFYYTPKYEENAPEIEEPKEYTLALLEESIAKQQYDTLVEHWEFKLGLREGKYTKIVSGVLLESGHFHDDKESGEWIIKEYQYTEIETKGAYNFKRSKDPVLRKHFTYANPKKVGRSVIIRNEYMPMDYWYNEETEEEFNLELDGVELQFDSFSSFFDLYDPESETEDIELPHEDNTSYEGAEEEFNYYDEMPYFDGEYEDITLNKMIDSLGYQFKYEGVYEEYYENGQLKLRFEVRDGVLVKEDTVFWDNGEAANVINFLPDSNIYEQLFYGYDGKLFQRKTYDAKGNPLGEEDEDDEYGYYDEYDKTVTINGREYRQDLYWNQYIFEEKLKLADSLTEKQVIGEELWIRDSSLATLKTYDPVSRTLSEVRYDISNKPIITFQTAFSDDFSVVTSETNARIANLRYHNYSNGSYIPDNPYKGGGSDSVLPERITYWRAQYDRESDATLYLDEAPFTGSFSIALKQGSYALKTTPNNISFRIPKNESLLADKVITKYYKNPKGKRSPLMDYTFMSNFMPISNGVSYLMPYMDFMQEYSDDYEGENPLASDKQPVDAKITGMYLNGKPEGQWKTIDQYGDVIKEASFVKGEPDGTITTYGTALPLTKKQLKWLNKNQEYLDYLAEEHYDIRSEHPQEKVRYVSETRTFRNGMANGPAVQYNWKGDTTSYEFYKDGSLEGLCFERDQYVYSTRHYEDGLLDGLAQTWITLPDREPILLYDLNFQNGGLQGESKAYHTNGKLAKHGFFLSNQPIDDYEAFDTLGVRYQYVKFLYGQPVEEKIWEENQLSVRYTFDWRDSIPFETWDIAESSSLDRLLVEMDWSNGSEYQPYFGRPSLVDKASIDYTMTKYYPDDKIAREGMISSGKKVGCWNYYNFAGRFLYEVDYKDTIIVVNDSIKFKSKGILTYVDEKGDPLSHSYVIEKFEKYDCSHTDHYEERMLYTFWEKDTNVHHINGYVKNYYDNGVLQNEGWMKDGLPTGVWKMYDNAGNLSHVGEYVMGKRQGRWLSGDLGQVKYLGDICLNPNLPNLEEIMAYQEKLLDISVVYYRMGNVIKTEYYGINMNPNDPPENYYGEEEYFEGDYYDERD